MTEYITKQQAIDLVKSLEVVLGCLGVSVLTREIGRLQPLVEDKRPCDSCEVGWASIGTNWSTGCHEYCGRLKEWKEQHKEE